MRIDAHQHFWEYQPVKHAWINDEMSLIRKNFLPEDLFPILKKHKIDGSIVVQADESIEETMFLLSLSEKFDFIKGVVGWADIKSPSSIDQIHASQRYKKLLGYRCIMQGQADEAYLTNQIFIKNVASLSELGFTYDLLIYHHQLPSLIKFVSQLPDNRMILNHIGKPDIKTKKFKDWKENIRLLANHPKIYCKLSGMITEADFKKWSYEEMVPYLDTVGEYFGVDRLCYGSDWPVCLVAGNYEKMISVIERWSSQLSVEAQNKIFGMNTCRFYNL